LGETLERAPSVAVAGRIVIGVAVGASAASTRQPSRPARRL